MKMEKKFIERNKRNNVGVVTKTPKKWVFKPTRLYETQVILLNLKILETFQLYNNVPSIKLSRYTYTGKEIPHQTSPQDPRARQRKDSQNPQHSQSCTLDQIMTCEQL